MTGNEAHNALGGNTADQLRAYVKRIENIESDIDGLNEDKRTVYAEVKVIGLDKPTVRKLIQRRRKNRDDLEDEDAMLELYEGIIATGKAKDPLEL